MAPLCGWFTAMETNDKAVFLSRLSWLLSFSLVWIGLLTEGWQLVKFTPPRGLSALALTVHYGLFKIHTFGSYSSTTDYLDWATEVANKDETAYPRVQATQACVCLALIALIVQFLASVRVYCSRSARVQKAGTILCAAMATADLAFTLLALVVWKSISSTAFQVLCSDSGCNWNPISEGFQMTPYYAWGFFIIKFILAFPGVVSLIYLCTSPSEKAVSEAAPAVAVAVSEDPFAEGAGAKAPTKKEKKAAAAKAKAEDAAVIAEEEGQSPSAASTTSASSKKGGGKKEKESNNKAFDKNEEGATYSGGSTGNPAPAWLTK